MISSSPLWAIVLRHAYLWRRDINTLLQAFYWPVLDILVWGFLGSWIQNSGAAQFKNYEAAALMGILLWQVVGRGANALVFTLSEELWSHNIINLFSLPLRITEWIIGIIIFYAFSMLMIAAFCMTLIFALYDISVWSTITTFLMFMPPLFLCGIWIGFTCLQIVSTLGKRGAELAFVIAWFFLPFSGAYYPIDVLPAWGKILSSYIPMSYVFQAMRDYLMYEQNPMPLLIKGYTLSALYAICSVLLFIYCFNRSKQKGLSRLTD